MALTKIKGSQIASGQISLSGSIVTGTLPVTSGGTGQTTAPGARTNLDTGNINNLTGILPVPKGGTGQTTSDEVIRTLNRAVWYGVGADSNGQTLTPGTRYGIWTGGAAFTMYLPTYASAVVGDVIECVDYVLNGHSWSITNFTVGVPANTYINGLAENLVCDVQAKITLTCTYKDGTNAWWHCQAG